LLQNDRGCTAINTPQLWRVSGKVRAEIVGHARLDGGPGGMPADPAQQPGTHVDKIHQASGRGRREIRRWHRRLEPDLEQGAIHARARSVWANSALRSGGMPSAQNDERETVPGNGADCRAIGRLLIRSGEVGRRSARRHATSRNPRATGGRGGRSAKRCKSFRESGEPGRNRTVNPQIKR